MCGRFSRAVGYGELMEAYRDNPLIDPDFYDRIYDDDGEDEWGDDLEDLLGGFEDLAPAFQTAPMDPVVVTTNQRPHPRWMQWGFCAPWFEKANQYGRPLINAKAETVASLRTFAGAWSAGRRCLIWTTGWYEWSVAEGRVPYHIQRPGRAPFAFAGIWSQWTPKGQDQAIDTVAILTTAPSPDLASIHDRMPCTLGPDAWAPWLAGDGVIGLLRPPPPKVFEAYRVGPRVGNVRNRGPELIEPVDAEG